MHIAIKLYEIRNEGLVVVLVFDGDNDIFTIEDSLLNF